MHVEEGPFVLTFKLSGGGIVSRVMETPETELPWFGEAHARGSRLVAMPDGSGTTPFQPIVRLDFEDQEAGGSMVRVRMAPHPGQHTWSIPFGVVALVLGAWGGYLLFQGATAGPLAFVFAVAFGIFPPLRARFSFNRDCARDLARLQRDLGLEG